MLREMLFYYLFSMALYLGSVLVYHSLVGMDWLFGNGWTVAAFWLTSPLVSMPYALVFIVAIAIPLVMLALLIAMVRLACLKVISRTSVS
jgi:hypothetical protein